MENDENTQLKSNNKNVSKQKFDIITKDTVQNFPEDILNFLMGGLEVEFLEHVETDFPLVEARYMDSLIKVRLDEELVLVHCEFQTSDSTPVNMMRRNIGYLGRCYERYGLPIFSHVVYLRPGAGENDEGGIVRDVAGYRFIVEYKVIQLDKVDGKSVLEAQQPGLMPFCPLMKPDPRTDPLQWTKKCLDTTMSLSLDPHIRDNLVIGLGVMAGIIHPAIELKDLITEDIMQESSFYQYIIEQGIEKGAKENAIESILLVLDTRFQSNDGKELRSALESIDDIQRLKKLLRSAAKAETLEIFISDISTPK